MRVLVSIIGLLLTFVVSAEPVIYKWVDTNGLVHYSDIPAAANAAVVSLGLYNTVHDQSINAVLNTQQSTSVSPSNYSTVTIVEPCNNFTSAPSELGVMHVQVKLTPALRSGDMLQLLLDEIPVGKPQASSDFVLNNVVRGSHRIVAHVFNAQGKLLAKSPEVTFFMQRPILAKRASHELI